VHRDVTPANVLVSREGEVKLVDFGLVLANARLFRTEAGRARGTIPYMAREQAAGEALDARVDVYGAAATLYELLTGTRARPEGPMGPPPAPLSGLRPDLPPSVDAVFERALADDVSARFPSAAEFSRALDAALAVEAATNAELARWVASLLPALGELRPRTEAKTQTLSTPATPAPISVGPRPAG
jgi:serine/threonine protein kinase